MNEFIGYYRKQAESVLRRWRVGQVCKLDLQKTPRLCHNLGVFYAAVRTTIGIVTLRVSSQYSGET